PRERRDSPPGGRLLQKEPLEVGIRHGSMDEHQADTDEISHVEQRKVSAGTKEAARDARRLRPSRAVHAKAKKELAEREAIEAFQAAEVGQNQDQLGCFRNPQSKADVPRKPNADEDDENA